VFSDFSSLSYSRPVPIVTKFGKKTPNPLPQHSPTRPQLDSREPFVKKMEGLSQPVRKMFMSIDSYIASRNPKWGRPQRKKKEMKNRAPRTFVTDGVMSPYVRQRQQLDAAFPKYRPLNQILEDSASAPGQPEKA
jgi:hypothetical protein